MLDEAQYRFSPAAFELLRQYIVARRQQPNFANARSMRNAFDRMRLRQSLRLFETPGLVDHAALTTIEAADLSASRVLTGLEGGQQEEDGGNHDTEEAA
jgi:hypothetical protein